MGEAERFLADAVLDEAVDLRRTEGWWRRATEDVRLTGTLLDLAERAEPVTVTTAAATSTGRIRRVGCDFVELIADGRTRLIGFDALRSLRAPASNGTRLPDEHAPRLVESLAARVDEHMACYGRDGRLIAAGIIVDVGVDVVRLRATPGAPDLVVVPVQALGEAVVGSG